MSHSHVDRWTLCTILISIIYLNISCFVFVSTENESNVCCVGDKMCSVASNDQHQSSSTPSNTDLSMDASNSKNNYILIASEKYCCPFGGTMKISQTNNGALDCTCSQKQRCCKDTEQEGCKTNSTSSFDFECSSTGKTIPLSKVNDDYCDCGNDEPLTSACSSASKNKGFICPTRDKYPMEIIPSSKVSDSVCDCCDGSDEPGIQCENVCAKKARDLFQGRDERNEIVSQGLMEREKISEESKKMYEETKNGLQTIKDAIKQMETEEAALQAEKTKHEAIELIERENLKKESYQQKILMEKLGLTNLNNEAIAALLIELIISAQQESPSKLAEELFDRLLSDIPALKNDVLFDDATMLYEMQQLLEHRKSLSQNEQGDSQPIPPEKINNAVKSFALPQNVDIRPLVISLVMKWKMVPSLAKIIQSKHSINKDTAANTCTDSQTNCSVDINMDEIEKLLKSFDDTDYHTRKEANEVRDKIKKLQRNINDKKSDLSKAENTADIDFGENGILIHFHSQCYSKIDGTYNYNVCPFDKISQNSISLGKYADWAVIENEEEGMKILDMFGMKAKYAIVPTLSMQFTKGQRCGNNVDRESTIYFRCGVKDAVEFMKEPETCKYKFLFSSPVACVDDGTVNGNKEGNKENQSNARSIPKVIRKDPARRPFYERFFELFNFKTFSSMFDNAWFKWW